MSDIYDYAYIHVMRHQSEVNTYSKAPKEEEQTITESEVNTSDFSPRDLTIFVDSLETITRLEKAKHDRRQRRKVKQHQKSFENSKKIITCLDSSLVGTSADEDAKSLYTSGSDNIYDETYYGMPYRGRNASLHSNSFSQVESIRSISSDSEESGVFLNHTISEDHLYENIDPIRARSKVITHPKCKSLKSRLISLIMKKQYIQPEIPSVELLSSTTYGEEMGENEIYDRVLDDVIQHQYVKNPKKGKRKYHAAKKHSESVTVEEKFLDKAMRFLTL